jgi:diguanylate cyclase (GGDEF)-like protein
VAGGVSGIGRAGTSAVRLLDDGVSRHHAELVREGAEITLRDLDSRNGTFVNGERVAAPVKLRDGDKIQIGRGIVLRFAYQDALDESFHERLLGSALRDPLTKLFNRRYLIDRLDSELKFARRHGTAVSLLMLDLDHFKQVNDTRGHLAGDAVLTCLAGALAKAVRNEDVVARYGGEELAIILRDIDLDSAAAMGARLCKTIEQTAAPLPAGGTLTVTVSIGVAGYPALDAETVEQLIDAADQALYRAKRDGRNRCAR